MIRADDSTIFKLNDNRYDLRGRIDSEIGNQACRFWVESMIEILCMINKLCL